MTAREAVDTIIRSGGVLAVEGDRIRYKLPPEVWHLTSVLAACKIEVLDVLRRQGGRAANFPHCPACASYALYRDGDSFECQTCGMRAISEAQARQVM